MTIVHRVSILEKFISTDILSKLVEYEGQTTYAPSAKAELVVLERDLDDLVVEFNSLSNDMQHAASNNQVPQIEKR